MRFPDLLLIATIVSGCAAVPVEPSDDGDFLETFRERAIADWETDIQRFEARDAIESHPDDAILFVGSSSIRLWETIAEDMHPYEVIQRGYGGARYSDLAVFAERIIEPHDYRALVMFVANDVSGEARDQSPEMIGRFVRQILDVSRTHRPRAAVFIVEITPTESRFNVWPAIRKVNVILRDIALSTENTYFIATAEYYLDASGHPRPELFVDDKLHLNNDGYALWTKLIRRSLDDFLGN